MGLNADLEAGGEDSLAGRGGNLAFVADIGTYEHDAAAVTIGAGGGLQEGAAFDHDIAVFGSCGKRCGNKGGCAVGASGNIEAREEELGVFVVEEAILNEVVVDR